MNVSKANIKFNYLYRDAGNYKNYGYVVFENPLNLSIKQIESKLRTKLIDQEFFKHHDLNIPALYFENLNVDDHEFHEFESFESTEEKATDNRTISEFLH